MRFAISVGHGEYIRGASGSPVPPQLDEVDAACLVVSRVAEHINDLADHSAVTFFDQTSRDQSTNLATITNWHNSQSRDYDVSVHFNAFDGSAHGCEVLYVSQEELADKLVDAISAAGHFTNRGPKYRGDLYVLNNTEMPAVLLEVCFCDNTGDSNNFNTYFDDICISIAEALTGDEVTIRPDEPKPPEPEQPPEPPGLPTEENRVDMVGHTEGDVAVIINHTLIHGNSRCRNVVRLRVAITGDVIVSLNGEEFHNKPDQVPPPDQPPEQPAQPDDGIQDNHRDIEATVFGGSDDPNNSAYPPFDLLDGDNDLFVALPYSWNNSLFPDQAPIVRVFSGELSVEAPVADKGPWMVDDADYVMGDARPLAETCHNEGTPLPRGPNQGKVPSNSAGIDLSPALADMLNISGKGVVSWMFVGGDDVETA